MLEKQGKVVRVLCIEEGITITELAKRLGISRQALYRRLEGGMTFNHFEEILRVMGYSLYYGKDGKIRKIPEN